MSENETTPKDGEGGSLDLMADPEGRGEDHIRLIGEPRIRFFAAYLAVLTLAFGVSLIELVRYSLGEPLHSHVVLIPFVTAYLIYLGRRDLPRGFGCAPGPAFLALLLGLSALGWLLWKGREALGRNDALALVVAAYLCFLLAGASFILGRQWLRSLVFPLFFLVFMIPLPDGIVAGVERGLVLASAEASAMLFSITGTPFYRTDQVFELPGIVLEVARECSGIRSSWVLFITSILASYMLLKSPWRRVLLVGMVIPLGIFRNGLRILVIGLLCVHRGPHMIDSPIHRSGGPYFFALSLIPLFLFLWWLRRRERVSGVTGDREAKPMIPVDPGDASEAGTEA